MISDELLDDLLNRYKLKITKKRREYLKNNANYEELSKILSFLVDELNISVDIIKKYPSILYSTFENVKTNYLFLEEQDIYDFSIETYTSLLSTNSSELIETYEYILNKYGQDVVNHFPKVLGVNLKRLVLIENSFSEELPKEAIVTAARSKLNLEEINEIIKICKENNIEVYKTMFNQTPTEIRRILDVCKEKGIDIDECVFYNNSKSIKKMCEICEEQRIYIENSMFACPMKYFEELIESCKGKNIYYLNSIFSAQSDKVRKILRICDKHDINVDLDVVNADLDEILEIIKICKDNHVRPCKEMFDKKSDMVLENILFCKERKIKNINGYYFKRDRKTLEETYKICELYGLQKSDEIFSRTKEEIKEIIDFCIDNEYKLEYSMFNHTLEEIKEIIKACERKNIPLCREVYLRDHISLGKIVTIIKRENYKREKSNKKTISFTPLAFLRTPTEVERILKICEDRVEITPNVFKITPYDVDTIIKILKERNIPVSSALFSIPASELEDIINYCEENNLRINSQMLFRSKEEIEDILDICHDKKVNVLDYMYRRNPDEVSEIVDYCLDHNVDINNNCFLKKANLTKAIIDKCIELGIPIQSEVFKRNPYEIEKITEIFRNLLYREPLNTSFGKTPKEVEDIINLLIENDIEVSEIIFRKRKEELAESIEFIKSFPKYPEGDTYKEYLKPEIIIYDKNQLARVFAYLNIHRLRYIKEDSAILKLSIGEISEREAYLYSNNGKFIEDGRINKIFSYTKKKFQEIKNGNINSNEGYGK